MFIGSNDIKTTNSYDVENIRALKMLSTSLKEINDSLDVEKSFRDRSNNFNKREEDFKNATGRTLADKKARNAKRKEYEASKGTANPVREEAENSDDLLNERLFGFRVARNDWINAKANTTQTEQQINWKKKTNSLIMKREKRFLPKQ